MEGGVIERMGSMETMLWSGGGGSGRVKDGNQRIAWR